jgi:hypothetical protein
MQLVFTETAWADYQWFQDRDRKLFGSSPGFVGRNTGSSSLIRQQGTRTRAGWSARKSRYWPVEARLQKAIEKVDGSPVERLLGRRHPEIELVPGSPAAEASIDVFAEIRRERTAVARRRFVEGTSASGLIVRGLVT